MILLRNSLIDQALKALYLMRERDRFSEEPEEDTLDCGFLIAEALLLWIGIAGCFRTRASCDRQIKNAQDRPARNTCPRLPAASAAWADRAAPRRLGVGAPRQVRQPPAAPLRRQHHAPCLESPAHRAECAGLFEKDARHTITLNGIGWGFPERRED
jgi:hypothetical protein